MDDTDKRLLNLIQEDFPITAAPFAEVGDRL
ncbi:MAG: AsnC family protein, partial [Proteobacteria bacterium]|nr:AsnC family protein [Pseudomonadota bacterium]